MQTQPNHQSISNNNLINRSVYLASVLLIILGITLPMVGCSWMGISTFKANETRNITAPATAGQSLRVNTANGKVAISIDQTRQDVSIEAAIRTGGSTLDEAQNRLAATSIITSQANGNVLDISVDYGPEGRKSSDSCSFTITLPAVSGIFVKTSNGSIQLTDTSGAADLHTSNGSVTLVRHDGPATIKTSNGKVTLDAITGQTNAKSSNGTINYSAAPDNTNPFSLQTSNGSIHITIPASAKGTIDATTSNGSININKIPEQGSITGDKHHRIITLGSNSQTKSKAHTSNGSITITINQ